MTYGGTPPTITPSYSGFVNGETASVLTTAPTCSTTATSTSPVDTYDSSCSGAAASNYSITYVNGSVTVISAALTISAASGSMTYGSTPPTITPSFFGFVNGETAGVLTTQPTCSTTATSTSPVDTYDSSCSGAAAANYSISYVNGSVTVNPAALTISASSGSMTYGSTPPTITPNYSGFVNGETAGVLTTAPTCSTTATSASPVDTYDSSCSGAAAANYSISYVNGTVTVNPAALTITASSGSLTYGGTPPTITPSYSGFVNGETAGVLTTAPVCSTTATSTSGVGDYDSSCSGASADNYSISYVNGTVTVEPAPLQVVAEDKTKVYGEANPVLTFRFEGFVNGEDATVVSGAPGLSTAATVSSGAGTYPITVSAGTLQAANYRFVLVDGTLTIDPAPLRVIADDQTRFYSLPNPLFTYHFEGFVLDDTAETAVSGTPELSTSATEASDVGDYPIEVAQGTLAAPNYRFEFVDGTLTITPAPTDLDAKPQVFVGLSLLTLRIHIPAVTATLTAFGQPLAGRTVQFRTNGQFLCQAVTDANGTASCVPGLLGVLAVILNGRYTATYSGELNYQPATDTEATIVIG